MKKQLFLLLFCLVFALPIGTYSQNPAKPDTIKRSRISLYMELGGSGYIASIGVNFNIVERNYIMFYNSLMVSTHAFIPYLDKNIGLNYGIGVRCGRKVFVGFQTNVVGYYSFYLDVNNKNIDNGIIYGSYSHQLPIGFRLKNRMEFILLPTLIHPFNKVRYNLYLGFGINLLFNKRN